MAYATTEDVQERMTRPMSKDELDVCETLLDDAAVIIDAYNKDADKTAKKVVSCRMVIRSIGSGDVDTSIPLGATQGSMSALGYSQSWTIGTGGSVGELYLGKLEKKLLGMGDKIGSKSPIEDVTREARNAWYLSYPVR